LRAIENGAAIHFFLSFSATQFRHCEECKAWRSNPELWIRKTIIYLSIMILLLLL
jgi:hypothetical protein